MAESQHLSIDTDSIRASAARLDASHTATAQVLGQLSSTTRTLSTNTFDTEIAAAAKQTVTAVQHALGSACAELTSINASLAKTRQLGLSYANSMDAVDEAGRAAASNI